MRIFATLFLVFSLAAPALPAELQRYAVVLTDEAPARAALGNRLALEPARATVAAAQDRMKAQLRARGVVITGEARTLVNAIFIQADPADALQLNSLPGVNYVTPLQRVYPLLDRAEQLINVPAAWNRLGGLNNAGAGMKIAIIDSGIEATHPAFQDATLTPPPGYPKCLPADCPFTNNKIIAARTYVASLSGGAAEVSRPDDLSPRDRVGHGTAVAMAAAGNTNAGISGAISGVAPKAFLGNYKVFGSPGVNDYTSQQVVIKALEDAYNDGMDVAILALGSPAFVGPLDTGRSCNRTTGSPCDLEAATVQAAMEVGLIVVAAAGNNGDAGSLQPTFNTVTSPANAPNAIAVGATTNSHSFAIALTIPDLGTFRARFGNGPAPTTVFSGPVGDALTAGDPQACTPLPAGSLTGLFALVQRGNCDFSLKLQNLQEAGAIGALIINNPGDETLVTAGGLGDTKIPAVLVGNSDGLRIRAFLETSPRPVASVDPALSAFDTHSENQVASFSSRGPVVGSNALKPDVVAVGADILLAAQTYDPNGALYSPSGYLVTQGSSFSAPQVAGVAALVKQQLKAAFPALTALQVKSAIVNTATQDVTDGGAIASLRAVGAGKVDARAALVTPLVALPATLSFGALTTSSLPTSRTIQLTNVSDATLALTVGITRRTPETSARLSVDRANIPLAAGQTATVTVLLSGTPPVPGAYEGFITVQAGASSLQIPYLYLVGDGIPYNIIPVAGDSDNGITGRQPAFGYAVTQVIDRYGVPVQNYPVTYATSRGGGRLQDTRPATDNYGFAIATTVLGPAPGPNTYTVTAGALSTSFTATARLQPTILPDGVVSAADFSKQPPAPGSYISIFGVALSDTTQRYSTPYLPIALNHVSVSFDAPGVSVPGRIVFISPGQVNVQIPWELQGQTSVRVKVSIADASGAVYTLPLAAYSPAFFEYQQGGNGYAAALDENNRLVSPSNPVVQGHIVQLYLNGLGPVANQPASGEPAPGLPLATTLAVPVVTIGSQQAEIKYSGLVASNPGLYQINAVVPKDTGNGIRNMNVSIGGVTSAITRIAVQ